MERAIWIVTKNLWPGVILLLSGCVAPGEFAGTEEAVKAAAARKDTISRVQQIDGDFEELWNDKAAFEEWKAKAVPILRSVGVTKADLHHRGTEPAILPEEYSDTSIFSKTVFSDLDPKISPLEVKGGLVQIPGRFVVSVDGRERLVRSSRGRCELKGEAFVVYAYDIFDEAAKYWLRCSFWVPEGA